MTIRVYRIICLSVSVSVFRINETKNELAVWFDWQKGARRGRVYRASSALYDVRDRPYSRHVLHCSCEFNNNSNTIYYQTERRIKTKKNRKYLLW